MVDTLSVIVDDRVLVAGAWYGYLASKIEHPSRLVLVEGVGEFAGHLRQMFPDAKVLEEPITALRSVPPGSIDKYASLVGYHHVDKRVALQAARRVLRVGGHLVIAEVILGSRPALFLDEVVARLRPWGHEASFWSIDSCRADLVNAGFHSVDVRAVDVPWKFRSMDHAVSYCSNLLQLEADPALVEAELVRIFGAVESELPWQLLLATATK